MPKPPRSRRSRQMELNAAVEISRINRSDHVLRDIIKYGCFVMIAMFVWLSVKELAGKITIADLKLAATMATNTGSPEWKVVIGAIVFGVGGIMFGRRERRLRKDTVERLHPYQLMWEKEHDPKRTSSLITKRGDTRPEDV